MSTQQDIYAAGSENRPPMLNKDNYVPWSSREPDLPVTVPETFHEQTDEELTENDIKRMDADDQAIQTILLGLPEDVYAAVDSCETAKEIWERVRQMMKGSDIGEQEKKAKLFNEWEKFTSTDGESIESYYHRFMQLMNDLKRNKHFPENIAANLKFLNNLQPEWKRHVTIVRQTKNLHEADFTQIYDFLKMNQDEVNELRAERLAKTHDPLALMAHSQNPYNFPATHNDQSSSSTHSQQSFPINNKYNPQPSFNQNFMQPPMTSLEDINDPTEAMNAALILFAKAFQLTTPTNNNQRTSSNPRNRQIAQPAQNQQGYNAWRNVGNQVAQNTVQNDGNQNGLVVVPGIANQNGTGNIIAIRAEGTGNGNQVRCYNCRGLGHIARNCTARPRRRDDAYLQTQLLIAQKEEAGIQLQAEEFDFMAAAGDLDEIEEVNANCILMENLQQASTFGTQLDKAPIYDTDGSAEVVHICLWCVDSGYSKHMTGNIKLLINFVWKFLVTVYFGNDHIAAILGYGDLKWGNIMIAMVYFVKGLGHNLFLVGQFCDADLEVAFRRNTCFIRDLDGVDLLKGNRTTNLYTINLYDMASASPICLMARATPTKSWLRHQRLSHLNFDTINHLDKNDLVSSLPKFKYAKEHLCPSLDDYSRYTWVHFLKTKDETLEVIKNFLKNIFVCLQAPVIIVHTDNGTEFKNLAFKEYFDSVGIIHETSAAKTPQQNGVVKRRNRTLVEAARTMLIFSHALLFLWAEAIATACYTQNRSKIISHEIAPIINQVDARVQNFKIQFLKEIAKFVRDFKSLAKEADESLDKQKSLELENSFVDVPSNLQTELDRTNEKLKNYIIKKENEYAKLWNDCSVGRSYGKRSSLSASNTLIFESELETKNCREIEFQVVNYEREIRHLKTTYINLFDSITSNRANAKLHNLIYENAKLRAQIFKNTSDFINNTLGTSVTPQVDKTKLSVVTPFPKKLHASIPSHSEHVSSDTVNSSSTGLVHTARTRLPPPQRCEAILIPVVTMNYRVDSPTTNHDACLPSFVNALNSRANNLCAKVPPSANQKRHRTQVVQICLWCVDSGCSKHMTGNIKLLINFVWKFLGTVRFGNDHIAAILGYGDLKWGNITIARVYFVEGLGHNLFSVGQFCDADLEVAFRRNTCFIRDLDGVDLLKGNRTTNLYTINLYDMASASPICLMARATPTKSWLWHQRLSHLNFDTINDLAKNDLVSGLPKFKYAKEHLCPSCEQGKSKRASHPPKPVPNSKQRLHLLHMDLCGPMRVASINGKRKMEVVERYKNRTLVEACQNYVDSFSLLRCPMAVMQLLLRVTLKINVREDISKLGAKGDIGFFIGYSANYVAYRVSKPGLQSLTSGQISSGLELTYALSTITPQKPSERDLDILFEPLHNEYLGGQPSEAPRTVPAAPVIQNLQAPTASMTIQDSAPTPTNSSNTPNSSHNVDKQSQHHAQQQGNHTLLPTASAADNVPNAVFEGDLFINPFATPSIESAESSTQNVDPSNMHTFYQSYPYDYQ
ncbi:retrovirus-related pol polyprotein from transposon TNT 1-94 [Tanacetum coccineum]